MIYVVDSTDNVPRMMPMTFACFVFSISAYHYIRNLFKLVYFSS